MHSCLDWYFGKEGLISFSGGTLYLPRSKKSAKHPVSSPGMPDPTYFPFLSTSAEALVPNSYAQPGANDLSLFSWFWTIFSSTRKSEQFTISMYQTNTVGVNIVIIKVDGQGMSATDLKHVLSMWNEKMCGAKWYA